MKRHYSKSSAYDRVMSRTKIPENKDECWLWCGPVNNAGYGMIRGNDGYPKMTTVHRVVADHKGLNIKRKEVQHTCLVKNCVNPDHLVIGTTETRYKRMYEKYQGRWFTNTGMYKTCEHCKQTTHIVWFGRKHSDCYPGMLSKYSKFKQ